MGRIKGKQSNPSYDDYSKKESKKKVNHRELKLNGRIKGLTESISKLTGDSQDLSYVKENFNKELREINASIGDVKIQASLLKLSDKIREKFNSSESQNLAFQIQCTAQGLTPDPIFKMEDLPNEIQQQIFYVANVHETTDKSFNNLLASKLLVKNASVVKNEWINANHISLKTLGCESAKEAIKYVIDHQLKSANLSEFSDLTDEDLENLCKLCPRLEKLSISSQNQNSVHSSSDTQSQGPGEKFVEVLAKLTNLQSLNVSGCHQLPGGKFVEVLAKLTNLQSLNVSGCHQLPGGKFVEMLEKKTNLKSLDVKNCNQLPGEQFVEALEKLPNLQSLNVTDYKQLPRDKFVEALEKMNLKMLIVDRKLFVSVPTIKKNFPHLKIMLN